MASATVEQRVESILKYFSGPKSTKELFAELTREETTDTKSPEQQVVSKKRVADHGEVLTGQREVHAMLDLVKQETERIESRFFEPACGTGNFLVQILERKLRAVETHYGKNRLEFERHAVLAVSSIYGIDILEDNIQTCRARLFYIFCRNYALLFPLRVRHRCLKAVQYILSRNVLWGNTLTLRTMGDKPQDIIFSEWSRVDGNRVIRRDFAFCALFGPDPRPEKEYPPIHFLELADGATD